VCADNTTFTDNFGYACKGWAGYNCTDVAYFLAEGYEESDVLAIAANCPVSCELCIPEEEEDAGGVVSDFAPCFDDPDYKDSQGYKCDTWVGYDCLDADLLLNWGYFQSDVDELPQNCMISCGLCEFSCGDSATYKDSQGYSCPTWVGYDCADTELLLGWGYFDYDVKNVQNNCPFSCGLCELEVPCEDDPDFKDSQGYACGTWAGYDCEDTELLLSWGYFEFDVLAVQEKCPDACGFCAKQDALDTLCVDKDQSCKQWVEVDCFDLGWQLAAGVTEDELKSAIAECPSTCLACDDEHRDRIVFWDSNLVENTTAAAAAVEANVVLLNCTSATAVAAAVEGCADNAAFTDSFGYACKGWVGYNCTDVAYFLAEGYEESDALAIATNCPLSCELCGVPEEEEEGRRRRDLASALFAFDFTFAEGQASEAEERVCATWSFEEDGMGAVFHGLADDASGRSGGLSFAAGQSLFPRVGAAFDTTEVGQTYVVESTVLLNRANRASEGRMFAPGTISYSHCDFEAVNQIVPPASRSAAVESADDDGWELMTRTSTFVATAPSVRLVLWGGPGVIFKDIAVRALGPRIAVPAICQFSCALPAEDMGTDTGTSAEECADNAAFTDSFGYACKGWAGYNCTDVAYFLAEGYEESDALAIAANCPVSCELCIPEEEEGRRRRDLTTDAGTADTSPYSSCAERQCAAEFCGCFNDGMCLGWFLQGKRINGQDRLSDLWACADVECPAFFPESLAGAGGSGDDACEKEHCLREFLQVC
jgi:hypothetical protein